jgi:hypothetical protein
MPPEQAHGKVDLVEERSDVYAVGALLHHLLTGQIPHLRPGERGVAPREILARVRRGPPPPVHAFHPHVPPALAAVCDKAMAREIEQRYASMEALAEDLHAFLENRVVAAHRTGPLVELGKWVQRNRGLAASFTGIALAVLLGVAAVLTVQSRSNARLADTNADLAAANERVERERDAAALQAAIASEVGGFLDRTLRSVDPFLAQGEAVTVRDALDAASERLEGAFQERPLVEAALRTTVGVTYRQLGLTSEAEPHLRRALALRETELGADAAETLLALEELAILLRDQGRLDEAEPLLRRAATWRSSCSTTSASTRPTRSRARCWPSRSARSGRRIRTCSCRSRCSRRSPTGAARRRKPRVSSAACSSRTRASTATTTRTR